MSDNRPTASLAGLVRERMPLAVAGAPLLFVFFGAFLPIAAAAGFPVGFRVGTGIVLAASSATVFALERRLTGARNFGAAAQFREFVGVMVGAGLLVWALLRLPFGALLRSGEFWAAVVAAAVVFGLSTIMRRKTARWEFFVTGAARMAAAGREGPESDTIAAVTRELSVEAGESNEALRAVRRWLIFFLIWDVGLLAVIGWGLRIAGTAEQIGACASSMLFLAGLISVGRMREEQHLLTLGLAPAKEHRSVARAMAAVLFAATALLAAVLSLEPALISRAALAAVASWIAWLLSHIPSRAPRAAALPPRPLSIPHPLPDFAERLQNLAPAHGSRVVAAILTYLGWSLAAAAAAGLLWLLLAPLFRLHRRNITIAAAFGAVGARIVETLRRWASEIRSVFDGLRQARVKGDLYGGQAAMRPREGRARRRTLVRALFGGSDRRFSGAFRRLTRWGEARGAAFATALGPREYAMKLASRVPAVHDELDRIAELYERNLFAPEPLSARERTDYFRMIREVMNSGRS